MKNKNVVIIGAGVGGLATAIHLAKAGHKVTIIEKNGYVGGRCSQIIKDGYHFDAGPTFLIFPDLYREMFAELGLNLEQEIELLSVTPSERIFFDDGSSLDCTTNIEQMHKQLGEIEPGSERKFDEFLKIAKRYHKLAQERIIRRDFDQMKWNDWTLQDLWQLTATRAIGNHYIFMKKFFHDPRLQAAFSFQDTYIGLDPYDSPAIFSIFAYEEFSSGVYLPRGGMAQIVKVLANAAEKLGAKIVLNSPVTKIEVVNNLVTGVVTENGFFPADLVVGNADITHIANNLVEEYSLKKELSTKEYACSTITFFWGLKKQYPRLATHNLFLCEDYQNNYNRVVRGHGLPESPHFYIHVPNRTDPVMAPEGKETMTAIIPIGHMDPGKNEDWEKVKEQAKKYIFQKLKGIGIKDLENQIEVEKCVMPPDWERQYNLAYGTTLGLHHNLRQMAYFRPKRQHRKIKNLFFVGSNTHPGSGVPTVMLSALFTSRKILNNFSLIL